MTHAKTPQPAGKKRALTIELSEEAYDTVTSLAQEFHLSKGAILRAAFERSLLEYLGGVRYISEDQGKIINRNLIVLYNELTSIKDELHRQGVNLNQIARTRNIAAKLKEVEARERNAIDKKLSMTTISNIVEEKNRIKHELQEIKNDSSLLTKEEFEAMIDRVEAVINKAGDTLWKLQNET